MYTYDGQGYITTEKATEYVSALPSLTGLSDPLTGGSFLMPYGWGRMNASLYKNLTKNGNEAVPVTKNTRYTYDEDGKLTRAVESGWKKAGIEYVFEYDAKGNRTYYEKREAGIAREKVESIYDKGDRLVSEKETNVSANGTVSETGWTYTYDGDGNLVSAESNDGTSRVEEYTYVYEVEDRLKAVYDPEGLVAAYTYDGDGNRVLELSYDTELRGNLRNNDYTTVNAAEAALTEYLGDEERALYEITRYVNDVNREYAEVLMERDGAGSLSTAYVYGNERISVRSTKKESGYYLYDGRGSVTGIVSIMGERLESYSYDPAGNVTRATSTNRYQKTFYGYNGESYDPKTGSVYLRARYYNTRTGSFQSKDTYLGSLMDPLSQNRYAYTQGNPVNYQDPSGLEVKLVDEIYDDETGQYVKLDVPQWVDTDYPLEDYEITSREPTELEKQIGAALVQCVNDLCDENPAALAGFVTELNFFLNLMDPRAYIINDVSGYAFGNSIYASSYYKGRARADELVETLCDVFKNAADLYSDVISNNPGAYWSNVLLSASVGAKLGAGVGGTIGIPTVYGEVITLPAGTVIGGVIGTVIGIMAPVLLELSSYQLSQYSDLADSREFDNKSKSNKSGSNSDSNGSSSESQVGKGSSIPVKDRVTAENGLDYQSNPKHTLGQIGNRPNAGIEPQNSLDLFNKSVESTKQPGVRFTYDESTGTLHRFADSNDGSWHWNGSTNQGANSLTSSQVPIDIIRRFNLPTKGW